MVLAPGTRIGCYEILEQIGVGGMGEVYRAVDTNLKRSVAIKVLPGAVAANSDQLARFKREAEILASLNHPNVATVYGLEKADEASALVMELGRSLMFAGFRSRWMIPCSCAASSALRDGQSFSFPGRRYLAVSPDGTHVAFTADPGLWVRKLSDDRARPVAGIQPDPRNPFFSPDGRSLGYYASGFLWRVSLSGGAPTRIAQAVNPWSAIWTKDDEILYGQGPDGIWRVPAAGGSAEQLIAVAAGESAHGPQLLPDGDWVLFTLLPASAGSWDRARIVVQSLATGKRERTGRAVPIHGLPRLRTEWRPVRGAVRRRCTAGRRVGRACRFGCNRRARRHGRRAVRHIGDGDTRLRTADDGRQEQ